MPLPPPSPVYRQLVPATSLRVPEGFTRIQAALVRGLPDAIALDAEFSVTLFVPIGNALLWRDAAPGALVSSGDAELLPRVTAASGSSQAVSLSEAAASAPARLVVRRAGINVAALPLASGLRRIVSDDGGALGARLEILILGWTLHAGTLRGPGDFGSTLDLAWRRVDRGANQFVPPLSGSSATAGAGGSAEEVP